MVIQIRVVKTKFIDLAQLWLGDKDEIEISGFQIIDDGSKQIIKKEYIGIKSYHINLLFIRLFS
ncbi:hypothetical protein LQ50_09670 [Halalkalibacter okhensis]|uniref:Uncharacterized protein n=1 Tax=Halalkalibacter okhensis TaxID=333138 RepID=A0A0B0ILG9_9BACI|nr:hypothetical protein LQ50_09670 [Halalkalibacter okhensis]